MYVEEYDNKPTLYKEGRGAVFNVSGGRWNHSWRTGKRAKGGSIGHLTKPAPGTPLYETLRQRKAFYESLDKSVGSDSFSNTTAPRIYRGDDGHSFASIKVRGNACRVSHFDKINGRTTIYQGLPGYIAAPGFFPRPSKPVQLTTILPSIGFQSVTFGPSVLPTAGPQRVINNLIPRGIGLGETLVEIVRGNLPALISDLRFNISKAQKNSKLITRLKEKDSPEEFAAITQLILMNSGRKPNFVRSIGKDYLEVQFGVAPIIRQIFDIVKVLCSITDSLYGYSFRRKSGSPLWDYDLDFSSETRNSLPISTGLFQNSPKGAYWTNGTYGTGNYSRRTHARLDFRISLRATLAGRPTDALGSYYKDAPDIVRKLGLWYPSLGWDLLPYSWLVDWVLNIGAAIERSAFFGNQGVYPIDYAYVTYKSLAKVNVSKSTLRDDGYTRMESSGGYVITEALYRTRINPFGLPTGLNSLSSFQYSILAALGLAKRR